MYNHYGNISRVGRKECSNGDEWFGHDINDASMYISEIKTNVFLQLKIIIVLEEVVDVQQGKSKIMSIQKVT